MLELFSGKDYRFVYTLPDPSDTAAYYVQAKVYKSQDNVLMATWNLSSGSGEGRQIFSYFWQVPQDVLGHIRVIYSVYTDSGYTTISSKYGSITEDYFIQDMMIHGEPLCCLYFDTDLYQYDLIFPERMSPDWKEFLDAHGIYNEKLGDLIKGAVDLGGGRVGLSHRCPKIGEDGLCTIYENRPKICRDYICGKPECEFQERCGRFPRKK